MLTLFLAFAVMCPAWAERPLPPRPGSYMVSGDLSYFTTKANYAEDSSSKGLFNGAQYDNTQGRLGFSYDFAKWLRAHAGFSFAMANSESLDTTVVNGGNISRSGSGLNEGYAGALGWYNVGPVSLAPEVEFVYPFWRVDENSDSPLIGDGTMRLRLGGWVIWHLPMFQPFVFGAYEYRDGGRSSLLPYAVGVNFKPGIWWLQAEYRGFTSVGSDSDAGNRGPRENFLTRVNGGSFRFYSIEPEASEAAFEAGVRLGSFRLYAGFATTVTGSDAADGNTFYGGLSFTGKIGVAQASKPETPEEQFHFEKDKYDESLFIEENKGERKRIKKKPRQQPSVDKLLHETEKELQEEN